MSVFNGDLFNQYVNPILTWLGLLTFLFSVYISVKLTLGREWRFKKWRKSALSAEVERPAALVIDMIGKGADTAAIKYMKTTFPSYNDIQIVSMRWDSPHIKPDMVPKILSQFKDKLRDLSHISADRVYLFISAPTPITCIVAAELANFGGIVLMHWNNQDGVYENWGPLRFH